MLKKKPVTGMRDILPDEMALRVHCMQVIRDTYRRYGFTEMETPVVESLENLQSRQGGDNEKLIFRILKRGEKLRIDTAQSADDLSDGGLRYDLTVPLVRYYANHMNELPSPFKSLQMGNVFRADRPQKGRFRQFMQCDIDILGEPSSIAETELILATTEVLGKLGFRDFQVRISDRRLLHAMASFCGFDEARHGEVFITLDKLDKIGEDGVREELLSQGFSSGSVDTCLALFVSEDETDAVSLLKRFCDAIGADKDPEIAKIRDNLHSILTGVDASKEADFMLVFDPTLVRGMGYYTGTIFEIMMPQFGASCGGGGRYDRMIGMFTGQDVPACGFSIGFERIILLLEEAGFRIPSPCAKKAFLIEKGIDRDAFTAILREAAALRAQGEQILIVRMHKNKKFQKEQLAAQGYNDFREFFKESDRSDRSF
ncbi:MAG: histidine--tRNA ligase [Lachnospiraceae bacterium]|nr:histidine--tRNA ligase [Lachnospiraceae bacterium]